MTTPTTTTTTLPATGHRPGTARIVRSVFATVLALGLLTAPAAAFAVDDDANLNQTLDDLQIVHGERVLDAGHVDMGPKFDAGEWKFLIHDDVARADANSSSVWRYPDETVFHVFDAGKLTVPEDEAYAFLGADPGSDVWVVPQTQKPDVVWLGWNTQDPEVMQTIDRGVTMSLTGVQGPGTVTTYLQSGSFGEPQLLWDSRVADPQPVWVDVNTHTHANWVFTEPGVYLIRLEVHADLLDGATATDTQVIRFAVGSDTSPADAFAATWENEDGASETAPEQKPITDVVAPLEPAMDPLVPILVGVIMLVAIGLIAGYTIVIVRGNRAKKEALAAHKTSEQPQKPTVEGDLE